MGNTVNDCLYAEAIILVKGYKGFSFFLILHLVHLSTIHIATVIFHWWCYCLMKAKAMKLVGITI
jgi:hypothetical protein